LKATVEQLTQATQSLVTGFKAYPLLQTAQDVVLTKFVQEASLGSQIKQFDAVQRVQVVVD